jgi:hypothetical protein
MQAGPLSACIAAQHSAKCNEAKHGATTRSKGHAKFRRENHTTTSQTTTVQVRVCICHETHGADCGRRLWHSGHLVHGPLAAMQLHAGTIRSDHITPPHTTHASTVPLHRGCVVDVSVVTVLVAVVVWAITHDLSIAPTTMATAKSRAIVAKPHPSHENDDAFYEVSYGLSRSHGPFRTFDFWDILSTTA